MIGIDIGMLGVMAITASGAVGVLLALPGAAPLVTALAGAYFLYLAYRIATAPPLSETTGQQAPPSFVAGVLLSLVNPKGYAAMAALFTGFVLAAIINAVNLAWLTLGAALTRFFREPATNRIVNVTFAVLLIASVAVALLF